MDKQRPSTNLMKNKTKGELTDKKFINKVNEDENNYAKYLDEFNPTVIRSPLDILAEGLGPKQKVGFSDADDFVNRQLLILNEVDKVVKGKPDSGTYLKNSLQLLRNENTKVFISNMKKKLRKVTKDAKEYRFEPPNEILVLEKLGKIMKRIVLRDCFITNDKFGQIKKKKTDVLIKPSNFLDQYVYLQNKKDVNTGEISGGVAQNDQQRKREKQLKNRKLKWPDLKKFNLVKNTEWRVKFEEMQKGRPRAIFLKNQKECQNLFNHVILKKLQKKEGNLMQKIQSLALVYKVKQSEYFYLQEIQPFIKSNYTTSHLKIINTTLEDAMEENEMGEGRKERGGDDKSDFRLGNYKLLNKLAQGDFDDKKKMFATRIDQHLDFLDKLGEMDPTNLGRSPFKELDQGLAPTAREDALEIIKTNDEIFRVDGLQADDMGFNYLRLIISNSLVVVKLEKFLLENKSDDESTKSIYKVEIVNAGSKERESAECNSYKSAENKLYNSFETDVSVSCPGESLNDVKITITDLFSKNIIVEKTCNLMEFLERVHMENSVHVNFFVGETDADKDAKENDPLKFEEKPKGVLLFNIVLFPTNLEMAHLLCKEEVLEKQFNNFDLALKEIKDFKTYREKFFQQEVQKNKVLKGDGQNLFYFKNNYIDKEHFYVEFQEDSIASSFRFNNLLWFKSTLGKILSSQSIDLSLLTSDNIQRIEENEPFGNDLIYDLYIRTIYLLSAPERVLMNRALYDLYNKNFFANKNFDINTSMELSRGLIKIINIDLQTYFNKNDHLKKTQKTIIKNIVQRVFFFLTNNKINGKNYSVHYSKLYIPMIASIVLLNEKDVTDKDICLLSINAIFSTTDISNYTFTNHINYLSNCVSYFKFLFKKLYPNEYIELTKLLVEFDMVLANYLHNSFADVFDPVNFNIYLDTKNMLELLFSANDKNIDLVHELKNFEIRFSSFVDIMFLLQSFAAMVEKFKYTTEPNQVRLTMNTILIKQMQSSEITMKQILQLIEYIFDSKFFKDEYQPFKEGLTEAHLKKARNFMQLKTSFRKADLNDQVVESIIDEQLIKNNVFCLRLQSLYTNPSDLEDEDDENKSNNNLKTDKKDFKNFNSGYNNDDTVDEDIFFEVAEEAQPFYDEYHGKGEDAIAVRYLTCLVYLNNMDMALIESMSNQHKLKANLNNLYELNEDEFGTIVKKYVKNIPENVIPNLFNALCELSSSSRVPVLKLIILLTLSLTEDFTTIAEKLSNLIYILSSIIFREVAANSGNKKEGAPFSIEELLTAIERNDADALDQQPFIHFSEIVKYVITEVASLTPFNFFSFFVERLVDVQKPQVTTEIKHAKLHLGAQVIDITELCVRHHVTSTYSEGKSCIIFNDIFNDWMTDIFATLLKDGEIDDTFTKFDIFLEVYIGNIIRHYRIPFRIVHVPEIQVFCKQNQRIYFENNYDEHYLLQKSKFVDLFNQLPFNFLNANLLSQVQCPFFDAKKKLVILFNVDSKQVTKVEATFKDMDLENACDLNSWAFKNPKPNLFFSIETDQLSIALPYSVLFLSIKEIMYHVIQFILLNCKEMDFFKFIKMNLKYLNLSTISNKQVDPNCILPELKEYEKAVKTNTDLNLKVNINTSALKQ